MTLCCSANRLIMGRIRSAGWLVYFVFNTFAAPASDYMVKTWDVDDGLPESSISDVAQTPDGYLWVSTLNSGVSRFDGVRFVNFDLPFAAKFPSHGVRRLFVDASGALWLNGFGNYLASLRQGEFHLEPPSPVVIIWLVSSGSNQVVFSTKEGQLLESNPDDGTNSGWKTIPAPDAGQYNRCFADAQGYFWYRRLDGQVARIVNGKDELMSLESGAARFSVIAGDNAGRIAVASQEGLFVWADGVFHDQTPAQAGAGLIPRGLTSDGRGGWWLETNGRLRRCRDGKWIAESDEWHEQKRIWSRIRFEQPDGEGGLWLAYVDSGVIHIGAAGEFSLLTTKDGLPSSRVRTMMQDREGNVWASFERGGLARIRPRLFQSVGSRDGLADSVATSVCEDAGGDIWVGTFSGMVSRWHDGACTNFVLPLVGTHCEMSTVFPDAAGRVWIGTHGNGLWVWETNQFRNVLTIGQVGINIRGLFVSGDGRVWIASQDGLFYLANGEVHRVQTPESEADYPTALTEDLRGNIWVAMNTGALLELAGDHIEKFQPVEAAMRSRFAAVCVDAQGAVWIGTLGAGLLRFQNGHFVSVTTRDGLLTDYISQVVEDGAGGLWLGSPAGIISVRKELLSSRSIHSAFRVFGRDDGLPTVGCATASQPTVWRGRDGRIWFATANGLASVLPQDAKSKQLPPLVVIEEVLVDGQFKKTSLGGPVSAAVPLDLGPGRHYLEFHFTGLDFAAPERLRFSYLLEGWDETWMENRAERSVSYNGLPPGKYRFRVKACNGDGVWSETESSVAFVVPPHVWETVWFRVASLAGGLLLVAGAALWLSHVRHQRLIRLLEQQQALERERTRIAQDIHDDLGASLTRIAMLSQSALDKTQAAQPPADEVNRIYSTARAMARTMDEIVWAINPRHDSLDSVAAYFAEFVEEFLNTSGLKFRLEIPLELPPRVITSELRHNLFLAFKEALNNTVKHARASEVIVTLAVLEKGFMLSVEDNGQGFETTAVAGIRPDSRRTARGNGLNNMRRRLEELGGRCHIESNPGRGTRVKFEVDFPA